MITLIVLYGEGHANELSKLYPAGYTWVPFCGAGVAIVKGSVDVDVLESTFNDKLLAICVEDIELNICFPKDSIPAQRGAFFHVKSQAVSDYFYYADGVWRNDNDDVFSDNVLLSDCDNVAAAAAAEFAANEQAIAWAPFSLLDAVGRAYSVIELYEAE